MLEPLPVDGLRHLIGPQGLYAVQGVVEGFHAVRVSGLHGVDQVHDLLEIVLQKFPFLCLEPQRGKAHELVDEVCVQVGS